VEAEIMVFGQYFELQALIMVLAMVISIFCAKSNFSAQQGCIKKTGNAVTFLNAIPV
jgi:hypothetical protein